VKLDKFLEQVQLEPKSFPALCIFEKEDVKCATNMASDTIIEDYLAEGNNLLTHRVSIEATAVHPLKYIQLEQINRMFGEQNVELLAEPRLSGHHQASPFDHHNPHDFNEMDGAISGCPMMAHIDANHNNVERDEL